MSFAEDLHDCFELVNNHSIQRRKGVQEFIQLMEEKADLETAYAKGLEKLGRNQYFISTQGTLSHAILAMKNDSLNKAMQARILAENIQKDLVDPMKELLANQNRTLEKTATEGKRVEKERLGYLEKYSKYKSLYFKMCHEYEVLSSQLENPQQGQKRDKIMQRLVQVKQEIDESLAGYKDTIGQHNGFKDKYTDFMGKILEVYQKQEEQRLEIMKDSLRKLVVYETSYLRNLQYDIDNLARAMESVNIKSDIKQFVDEHASANEKNSKLVFEAFQSTHESFKNSISESPVLKIPQASVQNVVSELHNQSSIDEILKAELSLAVNKAWSGNSLSLSELNFFNNAVREHLGRKAFLALLEDKKNQTSPSLEEASFNGISQLFQAVITAADLSADIYTLRHCLKYMPHFHLANTKTTLQVHLKTHTVWKKLEYWDSIIQLAINEEIQTHEKYLVDQESSEDKDKRVKNIVFCQLGTFGFVIDAFEVDPRYNMEIISKYACRYNLSSDDMETLNVRDIQASVYKKKMVVDEEKQTYEVVRGIPSWLQELEGVAAAIMKRNSSRKTNKIPESSEERKED